MRDLFVFLFLLYSQESNQVRQPPIITRFLSEDLVHRNEVKFEKRGGFKLPCAASGSNLTWTWKHNGTIITKTRGIPYLLSEDGTLKGNYLSTEHSGTYQCLVRDQTTGIEVFSRRVQVAVTVVGKFTSSRGVVEKIDLGQPFSFKCPTHTPSYGAAFSWVGSLRRIEFSRNKRRAISPNGGLYISYVTKEDIDDINNKRGIRCELRGANTFQASETLKLEMKNAAQSDPKTFRSPSWAVVPASEEIAIEGRSKTLYCFAYGRPTPEITWKKNGQPITQEHNSIGIRLAFYGRSLYFAKANRTLHHDRYTCEAESSLYIGRPLIYTIKLLVDVAPIWSLSPPQQKTSIAIGGNGSLECQVTAFPTAKITWFKNGKQVQFANYLSPQPELSFFNSSHLTREGHKLNLRDVNYIDDGIYQCVAENRRGMITSATWVHVQVIPAIGLFLDKEPSVWERGNIVDYSLSKRSGLIFKSNIRSHTSKFQYPSLRERLYIDKIPKWSSLVVGETVLVEVQSNDFQIGKIVSLTARSDNRGGKVTVKTQENTKEFDHNAIRIQGMNICQFEEAACNTDSEDCRPIYLNKWLVIPSKYKCSCKEGYRIHPVHKCIGPITMENPADKPTEFKDNNESRDDTRDNFDDDFDDDDFDVDDFDIDDTLWEESDKKENQSHIGVILGSLFGALGVAAIVAFVLWKKFAKRMTSDERLRKRIIEEMVGKWKQENPDMHLQEKKMKVLSYFRNIPSVLKDRISAFVPRRPDTQPTVEVKEMQEGHDDHIKENPEPEENTLDDDQEHHDDNHHENPRTDAQECQGDVKDLNELTAKNTLNDNEEHLDDNLHQNHQTDAQECQGGLHDTTTREDQEVSHPDTQESHGDLNGVILHQEAQENQENPPKESIFSEAPQSDLPLQNINGQGQLQQDAAEGEEELHQEVSSQDEIEKS